MLPSIFISHGAPSLALGDSPARSFLESLPALLPFRPTAILIISAHWEESVVTLNGLDRHTTIHDFGGFPDALYEMRYPAPGSAHLVERDRSLLHDQKQQPENRRVLPRSSLATVLQALRLATVRRGRSSNLCPRFSPFDRPRS